MTWLAHGGYRAVYGEAVVRVPAVYTLSYCNFAGATTYTYSSGPVPVFATL